MKPFARILIAVLAAAALGLAASPGTHAAGAQPAARFSLEVNGANAGYFLDASVVYGSSELGRGIVTPAFRNWALSGKRADLDVVMYDTDGKPVARYHLEQAWPSKIEIGALRSDSNEVAVESITLCHEGFEIQ
jgi:T4-like virus tail tube protein gp19